MKYLQKSFSVGMPINVSDEDWEAAMSKPKVPMPDYLEGYQPGDTVPQDVWYRACLTASEDNPGFVSDAAHYRLRCAGEYRPSGS